MIRYLEEQPEVWSRILRNREGITRSLADGITGRKIKRILLIGSGSSQNAAMCAAQFYEEELGLEADAVVPTRIGALPRLLNSGSTLVFAVSQSGRSTSTIRAAETLKRVGFTVAGVTADESSPLAKAADLHLLIACGEEATGPKTKGMTATVLTLYLAGMCLCGEIGSGTVQESALCRELQSSFTAGPENISRCHSFCEANLKTLAKIPSFTLIADGMGYAVTCEGALKLLETLCVPASAYEFEEYLHGVNNLIAPGAYNLIILTDPRNFSRMRKLDNYCRANRCRNFVITSVKDSGFPGALQLEGSGFSYTQPFETLLFFQILSALGSEYKNINCDQPRFSDLYALLATKA